MTSLRVCLAVVLAFAFHLPSAEAQLAQPGPSGVVMGHIHMVSRNLAAHRAFWTALGGVPTKNGTLEMIRFPGGFVNLREGDPAGGTVGTVVNHVGFQVKRMADWMPKWQAAGLKMEPQQRPTQVYIIGPDDVRVEVLEEPTIETPIRVHHIHYFVPDPLVAQAWYVKTFGAVAGKRGQFDAADLPGINLTFSKADGPVTKTIGRALDHVGFEVRGLEAFLKKLEASGITLDRGYQKSAAAPTLMISYITDPWGTYIELTEGLEPRP